jgi:hypothetical protein
MSIVSAFLVFSMQAAQFVIALPASALLFSSTRRWGLSTDLRS